MEFKDYPFLEFDSNREAVIEPSKLIKPIDIPKHCVMCFFKDVIDKLKAGGKLKLITERESEMGKHPIYTLEFNSKTITVYHPGVGAPLVVGIMEEVIALGCRKFIACGGAGVLDKSITVGHIIVPHSAVRDEGTSYHYLPPSREVEASTEGIEAIKSVLEKHKVNYILSKTWTTDAFFRETQDKIKLRKSEGCVTVEMEASAFFSLAKFRNVILAQILYGGDDISGDIWDSRDWHKKESVREKIFWLAVESCLAIK